MNEEAKELRAFIRSNEAGEVAMAHAMEKYFEWGGGFDDEKFRICLRAGVLEASKAYAIAFAHPGTEGDIFTGTTRNQVVDGVYEEFKERYSSSDVATNLFLTLQTDGKFYAEITPLMAKLRTEATVGAFSLKAAQDAMTTIIRGHVPAFEAFMRRQEDPCEVLAIDLEQVVREMTDCYLDEFKVRQAALNAVDLGQPLTLGIERADGDFAVLATLNNRDEVVPPEVFQKMVGDFMTTLHEAGGVTSRIALVNREDAPDYLDEFEFSPAPSGDAPAPDF